MPWMRQVFVVGCFVIGFTISLNACPYCPDTEPTLSAMLAESDAADVVKFLESKNGEELSMQTTTFEVVNALLAKDALKPGSKIETTFGRTAEKGSLFLMMGQLKSESMEFSLPIPVDELGSEVNYVRKAPSPERPQNERLP